MNIDRVASEALGMSFGNRPQPNDIDLRRVSRLVERRAGDRHVPPRVEPIANGYRIVGPHRAGTDGEGEAADIARLEYDAPSHVWRLYSRDRAGCEWLLYDRGRQIDALMLSLIADPYRVFWP